MKSKIMIVVLFIFVSSLLAACATTDTKIQPVSAITATAESNEIPLSTSIASGFI